MEPKAKYHVCIKEVYIRVMEVEASTEEEAKQLAEEAAQMGGEDVLFEYLNTLGSDVWSVNSIKD
jgi:hypothetical protein